MAAAFRLGQTVRIAPGTYHGKPRPAYGTVTGGGIFVSSCLASHLRRPGEGRFVSVWKVIYCGWHMTYPESDLTDGTGHGAEAAGYANGDF